MSDASEVQRLQGELDRAYSQLAEITSRLLAVNEAADALVASYDQEEIAATLLEATAQTAGTRTGAVFLALAEGEFAPVANLGFTEEAAEAIGDNLVDVAIGNLVQHEKRSFDVSEARAAESFQVWEREQREADPDFGEEPSFELYLPLLIEERVLAVLALGPPEKGGRYGEDQRPFLEHIAAQGALALDRALLFAQNEDRLADLDALLRISKELTSTLDLDHVMLTAVNTTAAIVERERAVLALYQGNELVIRAVSDFPRVDSGTAERLGLTRLLSWLALKKVDHLNLDATEVEENESIEGREVLQEYFAGDMRALLVIGLADDQGPVGVLLLESYREDAFAQQADREALTVLSGQLAVSIRNAELYRQLPMVSALQPLAERRRRWQRMSPGQRRRTLAVAAVALVVVALIPWPRSVAGDARVLPVEEVPVRSAVGGILERVDVGPGDRVRAGTRLARLDPNPSGARLAELRAEALAARSEGARAEEDRDAVGRRLADLRRAQALARLAAARTAGARTELVAPADGYVLTPGLRELEGSYLEPGEVFCQVSDLDTLRVEVAVSEIDVLGLEPGAGLRIKVLGFPDRQFRGEVSEVSWQGEPGDAGRASTFLVRGWVENPGPMLRSGMTGRARVEARPATLLARWSAPLYRWVRIGLWL